MTAHTAKATGWIVLDASAPAVLLDRQEAIAGGQLGPGVKALAGETSARTAPVQVDLTAATGADQTRVRLTCQHGSDTGLVYARSTCRRAPLAAGSTRHWEGEIHQGSACRVELTTTAASGGVSGAVKVCGETDQRVDGQLHRLEHRGRSRRTPTRAPSPGCPAKPPVAGVQGVDLAFRSVLPGSAFVNEVPLAGEILHLPFEDTPNSSGGLTLRDVSGVGSNGSCGSGACPVLGQAESFRQAA